MVRHQSRVVTLRPEQRFISLPINNNAITFHVHSGCGPCFRRFVFLPRVIAARDKAPCVLIDRSFIMCIVIIYDAVRAVRFAGLETIRNNDAAVINFTGSRVTVLTQFRSGSCTLETPWVIGVFSAGTPWAIFRPNPPGVLVNITIENNMVNFATFLAAPRLQ